MILDAYRMGIFPMADSAEEVHFNFYRPEQRGLLPIADLHVPKSLTKTINKNTYEIRINTAFTDIIDGCAMTVKGNKQGRNNTWINKPIRDVFIELHKRGYAHSVESWQGDTLAGGLYGLAIGAVFCGESMVSFKKDASKVALVHLAQRLNRNGFTLLDTQFINNHLKQFGAYEMPQAEYEILIKTEMGKLARFAD